MTFPQSPIAAVTHLNPYAYYADLVAQKPIYHDEMHGLWIASSAAAVRAVLTSDLCRVRPLTEPIPRMLLGSPAATIFRYLVRMNDGERHCPFKQAVSATLKSIDATHVAEQCDRWAQVLLDQIGRSAPSCHLSEFAFQLPVYVLASLLGVPQEKLHQTALWMSDFVPCLAPSSSPEQVKRGKEAAGHLFDLFCSLLIAKPAGRANSLLTSLAWEAKRVGCEDTEAIVANGIGFLSQAYEATAGLIGNTIVAFSSHRDMREQVAANPRLLRSVIEEILRYDPPIQNTRRFLAQNGSVANQAMKEGDVVLVVLAAANRDPSANPHPERFDIFRKDRQMFTFGVGPHTCPGEAFAVLIALAGIEQLLVSGIDLTHLATAVTYRPSVNARIALLDTRGDA